MKNRVWHSGIKQSPYKSMFGIEPKVGLLTTYLSFNRYFYGTKWKKPNLTLKKNKKLVIQLKI